MEGRRGAAPNGPRRHRIARAEDAANPADGASRSHAVRDGPAGRAALEIAAGEGRVMPRPQGGVTALPGGRESAPILSKRPGKVKTGRVFLPKRAAIFLLGEVANFLGLGYDIF